MVGWDPVLPMVLTWFHASAVKIRTAHLVRCFSPAGEMRELLDPLTWIVWERPPVSGKRYIADQCMVQRSGTIHATEHQRVRLFQLQS